MIEGYDFSEAVIGKYAGKVARKFSVKAADHPKPTITWKNESVRLLAREGDPIDIVRNKARRLVLHAMDHDGLTLPIDPFKLAESRGIQVVPRPDIRDAQTIKGPAGKPIIEYNPTRSRARIRFSICHELGHTLFPDCLAQVRHRGSLHTHHSLANHELEMLCNLAAAEMLLPLGILEEDLSSNALSIDLALRLREKYEASTEAVLWRLMGLAESKCGVFAAAAEDTGNLKTVRYRIEYVKTVQGWNPGVKRDGYLPAHTVGAQCTAIGTTAKGQEIWTTGRDPLRVEIVGIAPYPAEQVLPRLVGFIMPAGSEPIASKTPFELLRGDALEPRGSGPKIVAHVVNDATANWGFGFGRAVQTKWPEAQRNFRTAFEAVRGTKLGLTAHSQITDDLHTFQMTCQHGYGPSATPRLRYEALRTCLIALRHVAQQQGATVHMPKIGTGQAGGSWQLVSNLIAEELCSEGVSVTVYEPTNSRPNFKKQAGLFD